MRRTKVVPFIQLSRIGKDNNFYREVKEKFKPLIAPKTWRRSKSHGPITVIAAPCSVDMGGEVYRCHLVAADCRADQMQGLNQIYTNKFSRVVVLGGNAQVWLQPKEDSGEDSPVSIASESMPSTLTGRSVRVGGYALLLLMRANKKKNQSKQVTPDQPMRAVG